MPINKYYSPIGDRILVEPHEKESINKENVSMPMSRPSEYNEPKEEAIKSECLKGTVVAVGKGSKEEPITVKVGDVVYYEKWCGLSIEIEDEEYMIIRQYNVLMRESPVE